MNYLKVLFTVGLWGVLCLAGCDSDICLTDTGEQMKFSLAGSKDKPLELRIPQTDTLVLLNDMVRMDDDLFVKGCYSITHAPDVVERGTVWLNTTSITYINPVDTSPPTDTIYFAASIIVSNQGSGVFNYIGLFALDPKTEHSTHLDSYLLGDRVKQIHIEDAGRAVAVDFAKHAAGQSFAEEPTEATSVNLYVEDDLLWRPYQGMHPSWDQNNDGINDCEDDGSCDDSIDYTKARAD